MESRTRTNALRIYTALSSFRQNPSVSSRPDAFCSSSPSPPSPAPTPSGWSTSPSPPPSHCPDTVAAPAAPAGPDTIAVAARAAPAPTPSPSPSPRAPPLHRPRRRLRARHPFPDPVAVAARAAPSPTPSPSPRPHAAAFGPAAGALSSYFFVHFMYMFSVYICICSLCIYVHICKS